MLLVSDMNKVGMYFCFGQRKVHVGEKDQILPSFNHLLSGAASTSPPAQLQHLNREKKCERAGLLLGKASVLVPSLHAAFCYQIRHAHPGLVSLL